MSAQGSPRICGSEDGRDMMLEDSEFELGPGGAISDDDRDESEDMLLGEDCTDEPEVEDVSEEEPIQAAEFRELRGQSQHESVKAALTKNENCDPWEARVDNRKLQVMQQEAEKVVSNSLENISLCAHGSASDGGDLEHIGSEEALSGVWVQKALARRQKYVREEVKDFVTPGRFVETNFDSVKFLPPMQNMAFKMEHGVVRLFKDNERFMDFDPIEVDEFWKDMKQTMKSVNSGPVKSLCFRRLLILESRFKYYLLGNDRLETADVKTNLHRDFYNVRKVDTHVHHSACMHQKHLLRYIRKRLRTSPDDVVIERNGQQLSLKEVFKSLSLTAYDLCLDTLDVHADNTIFHRFDRFNLKYNPFGQSRLREIFLKTDNFLGGKYLAEITKEVFDDLEQDKYQMAEYRLSIYGRNMQEWDKLANWVVSHKLSSPNVRWMVQIPRLYRVYKTGGLVKNFQEMLENIFKPLFEVTLDPASHPKLHQFLSMVVGFDSVDDESNPELRLHGQVPKADEWDINDNPPYNYFLYYLYANLQVLNGLRKLRGMKEFSLRPHCGEAGDIDHLAGAFLLTKGINHGINLRKSPVLQMLYYLTQIGLALSPMSNNALFLSYSKSPFDVFFKRGLNVSLSTDDPLQFHHTHEPLIEEYGIAKTVWSYSSTDVCEIARNSVLQSGFEPCLKAHWLGPTYQVPGPAGNDMSRSNVCPKRLQARHSLLTNEMKYFAKCFEKHEELFLSRPASRIGSPMHAGFRRLQQQNIEDGAAAGGSLYSKRPTSPLVLPRRHSSVGVMFERRSAIAVTGSPTKSPHRRRLPLNSQPSGAEPTHVQSRSTATTPNSSPRASSHARTPLSRASSGGRSQSSARQHSAPALVRPESASGLLGSIALSPTAQGITLATIASTGCAGILKFWALNHSSAISVTPFAAAAGGMCALSHRMFVSKEAKKMGNNGRHVVSTSTWKSWAAAGAALSTFMPQLGAREVLRELLPEGFVPDDSAIHWCCVAATGVIACCAANAYAESVSGNGRQY